MGTKLSAPVVETFASPAYGASVIGGGAVMGAPVVETFAGAPAYGAAYGGSVIGTQIGAAVDLGTAVVGSRRVEVPQMAVQQVEIQEIERRVAIPQNQTVEKLVEVPQVQTFEKSRPRATDAAPRSH